MEAFCSLSFFTHDLPSYYSWFDSHFPSTKQLLSFPSHHLTQFKRMKKQYQSETSSAAATSACLCHCNHWSLFHVIRILPWSKSITLFLTYKTRWLSDIQNYIYMVFLLLTNNDHCYPVRLLLLVFLFFFFCLWH